MEGSALFERLDRDGKGFLNMRELMCGLSDVGLDDDEAPSGAGTFFTRRRRRGRRCFWLWTATVMD